jgi:hypothetical protein
MFDIVPSGLAALVSGYQKAGYRRAVGCKASGAAASHACAGAPGSGSG